MLFLNRMPNDLSLVGGLVAPSAVGLLFKSLSGQVKD